MDRVLAGHCNQYGHVPGCPHGAGVPGAYALARENLEALRGVVEAAARAVGGRAVMRPVNKENGLPMKAPSVAMAKAARDYGGDMSRVVDLIGGTCVLQDDAAWPQAVEAIRAALPEGASVARVKPLGFGSAEPCYRDVKVNIRFANGAQGEVIVASEFMQEAKFNRGEHAVYEIKRVLEPLKDKYVGVNEAWKALNGLSRAIYSPEADVAAFERAKAKASSALQHLPLASMKASLSAADMMTVKSSSSLLNLARPLSVDSAAMPSSSEIKKAISGDSVTSGAMNVNQNNEAVSLPLPTSGARQEDSPKRSEGGRLAPHVAGRQGLAPRTAPQGFSPDGVIEAERAGDVKGKSTNDDLRITISNNARLRAEHSDGQWAMVDGQSDEVGAAGYTAAVDRFRRLESVPASEWEELEPGARAGKFFVAAVEDERLLEALRALIDECLEEGCSEAEFVHRASGLLGEMTDPETGRPYYDPEWRQGLSYEQRIAYDREVSNLDSAARLKLIFRTQWELGAGYAEWQKATEPKRLQRFPGWRFVRQPGAKTKRPDHVEHEGDVRLISDIDYWLDRNRPEIGGFNQPHGPWGFNSWMRVEPVSREECERLGLLAPGEVVEMPPAAAQWDLQHAIDEGNTASLDGLSPEGEQRVRERCREAGLSLIDPREDRQPPAAPAGVENTPLPVEDELERELLELIDELADWQDEWEKLMGSTIDHLPFTIEGANPYGCNGAGHYCPQKGTTREGETRPRRREAIHKKQKGSVEVRTLYHFRRQALQILNQQAAEQQGAIAPGMDKSFHISKESVKELTSGEHVRRSDNPTVHYTAAVNALKLWAHSEPFEPPHDKERDRYNSYEDSPLEWVHYRKAVMTMNGEVYEVKITAKEYKGLSRLPILYQVKAKKMHGLHARGGFVVAKTASTVQGDYRVSEE